MTDENSARGRANRAAGARAMRRAVDWLRANGAHNADRVTRPHSSDIVGIGDLAREVTIESWQQIAKKAEQAEADARARGLDRWCIWKPRRGVGDMGQAWCVTEFRQWWADQLELAELRKQVEVLAGVIRNETITQAEQENGR
jgi:hypothetical protein